MQYVLGRKLPEEVTRAVEYFYQDGEFTRQIPEIRIMLASRKIFTSKID